MKYIQNRAENNSSIIKPQTPHWVSEKNASLRAWQSVEFLKKQKLLYIKAHSKPTHFKKKQSYFISGSEIAKALKVNRSTLMHSSAYSAAFVAYLGIVNTELANTKTQMLENTREKASRGPIDINKKDLLKTTLELKKQLADLKQQNSHELVRLAFNQLSLPIKKKLGIQ